MTQGSFEFPERRHAHLRLAREIPTGARVPRAQNFRPRVAHGDQSAHGAKLKLDLVQLRAIHAKRVPVLGIDPENVVVVEFNAPPDQSSLAAAGLRVLDWFSDRVVITASDDPRLAGLMQRVEEYQTGPRSDAGATTQEDGLAPIEEDQPLSEELQRTRTAPYQALLDRVEGVRALSREEVITATLLVQLETADATESLLVDLQCWCPEEEREARRRHEETAQAVATGGGRVLDRTLRHVSGLSLLRVQATPGLVNDLATLSHVRRIDRLPRPVLSQLDSVQLAADQLPPVSMPSAAAPTIAVIDSGVRSGHPLIGPAFSEAFATGGLDPEVDGSGHGTFVASLALYGSLEPLLDINQPLQPAARLVSVRVLDDASQFPDVELWENHLLEALGQAVQAGARVINLSIGDERHPYQPNRPTPLAAEIDRFARENDVVVVISAGNLSLASHHLESHDSDYLSRLLDDAGLLDPATSALALTVGALGADEGQGYRQAAEKVEIMPVGGADLPSPITRTGPGAAGMVKPEVAMPGGHAALTGYGAHPRRTPATGVLGADGRNPNRLFGVDAGTSCAAPLVTHVAASVLGRDPTLTARAVRSLVLASVRPPEDLLVEMVNAGTRATERRLVGYGRPEALRAAQSSDHRAVLLAESAVPLDDVHLYRAPIPSSFFVSGGWRRETIALAFDPLTRATRLNYMGSRMQVQVYVGKTVDEVADVYLADRRGSDGHGTEQPIDPEDPGDDDAVSGPAALRGYRLDLQPADAVRSRGAHHFATVRRTHRRQPESGLEYVIAVQSLNRWDQPGTLQPYALAFVLERDPDRDPIYLELQAALEARVDVEVQI